MTTHPLRSRFPSLASALDAEAEVRRGWLPPPLTSLSEFSRRRFLSSEETHLPGHFDPDVVPWIKPVMDLAGASSTRRLVLIGSARCAKTEVLKSILHWYVTADPSNILLVYPTRSKARRFMQTAWTPMLRANPDIATATTSTTYSRRQSSTLVSFRGGFLFTGSAETPNDLDQITARVVVIDEVSKITQSAKKLGDPLALAKDRTMSYRGRDLHFLISTPAEEGSCKITSEYATTKRHELELKAPCCGTYQALTIEGLKWDPGKPETAHYVCSHCGKHLTEGHKRAMVEAYKWRCLDPNLPDSDLGFHFNALASPLFPWAEVAKLYIAAKAGGQNTMQVFVNEILGLTWKPLYGNEHEQSALEQRAKNSRVSTYIPATYTHLFLGADVQDDRLEATLWAYGPEGKSCVWDHAVIPGNPGLKGGVWDQLQDLILASYPTEGGGTMRVSYACVDRGGHYRTQVDAFARRPLLRGLASAVHGATRALPAPVVRGKNARFYLVDTTQVKDQIHAELKVEDPGLQGYVTFRDTLPTSYFQQLTSEKRIKGRWNPPAEGVRNETADTACYARAALCIWSGGLLRLSDQAIARAMRARPTPGDAPTPVITVTETPISLDSEPVMPPTPPEPPPAPPKRRFKSAYAAAIAAKYPELAEANPSDFYIS